MIKKEKLIRRYFHETRQPEVYFSLNKGVYNGIMTDFSDDEIRLLCLSNVPIETGMKVSHLYLGKIEEEMKIENLLVRRSRENPLTDQLSVSLFFIDKEQGERFRSILKKITITKPIPENTTFNAKKFPRFSGGTHYSEEAIHKRIEWLEGTTASPINYLNQSAFYPPSLSGNIENYFGAVQIPVGIAGPILVKGIYTDGYIPLPIATTEGALVSSITRGALVTNASGGIQVHVVKQQMVRAPVFICDDIHGAINLEKWVLEHQTQIAEQAERMSSVAKLLRISTFLFGESLHLSFYFQTGDAAGQNMTTSCSWFACEWIVEQIKDDPYIQFKKYMIDGNLAGDKKVTAQNFLKGRGVSVTATCHIPKSVMERFMRVSPKDFVRMFQIGEVAALHSGMVGHNVNFANAIAGLFVATGQDIACVHESACGIFKAREENNGLHLTVYLPSLVIGTVGGGTNLPTQKECLQIMGCQGQNNLFRFAEIIAASCMALDLSTASAIVTNEFVSAHERLGRNRNTKHLAKSEIDPTFFTELMNSNGREVVKATKLGLNSNEGLVSNLAQQAKSGVNGLFRYQLDIQHASEKEKLDVVLKLKTPHREVLKAASMVAKLSGEDQLPGYFETYHSIFGFDHCDHRELAFYQEVSPDLLGYCPAIHGIRNDEEREIFAILMEDLSDYIHDKSSGDKNEWTPDRINTVLNDLAQMHAIYWDDFNSIPSSMHIPKLEDRYDRDALVLLKEMTRYNAKSN
ncbi:MAG: hydroxymethylglutaryl-CoA reductase, partial [Bacteroidota bacterium]